MNVKYIPKDCQGDKPLFQGYVVLSMPAYDERMRMMIDSGLLKATQSDDPSQNLEYLTALSECVRLSYARYESVNLKRVSDNKKIGSIDELKYLPEAATMLQEVALNLASGSALGKS